MLQSVMSVPGKLRCVIPVRNPNGSKGSFATIYPSYLHRLDEKKREWVKDRKVHELIFLYTEFKTPRIVIIAKATANIDFILTIPSS